MNVKKTTSSNWSVLKLSNPQTRQPLRTLRDAGGNSSFSLCNSHSSFVKWLVVSIRGERQDHCLKEGHVSCSIRSFLFFFF